MIKVWCETCKGKGVQTLAVAKPNLRGIEYIHSSECETCKGKGYTEHEGSLEDLELAAATKLAFEHTHIPFTNIRQLVSWYREQKGGNL